MAILFVVMVLLAQTRISPTILAILMIGMFYAMYEAIVWLERREFGRQRDAERVLDESTWFDNASVAIERTEGIFRNRRVTGEVRREGDSLILAIVRKDSKRQVLSTESHRFDSAGQLGWWLKANSKLRIEDFARKARVE